MIIPSFWGRKNVFFLIFPSKHLELIAFLGNFAFGQAGHVVTGRVGESYWNPAAEHTGLPPRGNGKGALPRGKGRFRNVTVCKFKLRNFETKYRRNATEASAWVYSIQHISSCLCARQVWRWQVMQYHSAWACLRCLSLLGGNAKA